MLGFLGHNPSQDQHRDAVGNRHQAVGDVGDVPDEVAATNASPEHEHQEDDRIRQNALLAEEVHDCTVTVLAPAKNRGIGEAEETNHQHERAKHGNRLEAGRRKRRAAAEDVRAAASNGVVERGGKFRVGQQRRHEHEAGNEADDDRIPKCAAHRHESLTGGVASHRARSDKRGGAQAALVGEKAALEAELESQHDSRSHCAAKSCLRRERAHEDGGNRLAQVLAVNANDYQAAHNIEHSHDRNELLTDTGDALKAAEDDKGDKDRHDQADDPCGDALTVEERRCRDGAGKRVRLHRGTDAKGGNGRKQRKEDGEELAQALVLETALEGVHGAADHLAVLILHAPLHTDVGLRVLGGDAEDTRDPHPEDGTRTAGEETRRHAHDVAGADSRSKRRGQGAELADVAFSAAGVVFTHRQLDGRANLALDETRAHGRVNVSAQQQHDEGPSPNKCVNCADSS